MAVTACFHNYLSPEPTLCCDLFSLISYLQLCWPLFGKCKPWSHQDGVPRNLFMSCLFSELFLMPKRCHSPFLGFEKQ